jgi:hypothetical protein
MAICLVRGDFGRTPAGLRDAFVIDRETPSGNSDRRDCVSRHPGMSKDNLPGGRPAVRSHNVRANVEAAANSRSVSGDHERYIRYYIYTVKRIYLAE